MGLAGDIALAGVQYVEPPGGWTYIYSGDDDTNGPTNNFDSLDGTWDHDNNSDEWDGTQIGSGRPGGVMSLSQVGVTFLRLQDTGNPGDYGMGDPGSNRKLFFGHSITNEIGSPTADTILDDGVTLTFRARIATTSPLDDAHPAGGGGTSPWPAGGDGYVIHDGGKGIGIHQQTGGKIICFHLCLGTDGWVDGREGLVMNDLADTNPTSPSPDVDQQEDDGGTLNLLDIAAPTDWHEFWITIQQDLTNTGTHLVKVYMDGSIVSDDFIVTAGNCHGDHDYGDSYLSMEVGSTPQAGAIDIDFIAYKQGIYQPLIVTVIYVSTGKSYSVTTAQSDVLVYIDRDYTINTITDKLDDGHLVRTANDDRYVTEPNHLTLEISETAIVYVCYDERQTSLPTWLNDESWEFLDDQQVIITGWQGNDERYEVYKKDFSSGQFTLGGNHQGGDTGAQSNYFVIVQPISDNEPPVVDAGDTQAIVWDPNPGAENIVELVGNVTDDDPCSLGQLTILWSQLSGPNTVEFNDVTDPCTTVRLPEPGIYELLLQAWDEVPQQASDTVKIIANKSLIVDLYKDGEINFLDLAVLGKDWPTNYDFTNLRAVSEHWLEDINTVNTTRIYLSGRDKDDAVPWEFYCTGGRKSGFWTTIPVPSNWELHGFGQYNYGHDTNKSNEKGKYRYTFAVPEFWAGKKNQIVFEGAMTDTEVWINGKSAGTKHQGGFYRFKYDITDLVEFGCTNLLEVTVSKRSSNGTVEAAERKADYWVFGGIYRPVYIEALPPDFIDWTAIDARADGTFSVDVHLKHITDANNVIAQIIEPNGAHLANPFSAQISDGNDKATLNTTVINHQTWSAETPNLYKVKIDLRQGETTIHSVTERFGFRTIEVRAGEGIFLNGNRIRLKGVNRHCFWPDSGRSLSQQTSYNDASLIKQMNMNAVRMSHYPPDKHFLEVCDELGLYVLNELAGWQSPPYDTVVGEKLVKEMVTFSVNHPCILFWDNGNEGGWNTDLDDDFAIYDRQNRTVLHPWANFNNIDTDHYEGYSSVQNKLAGSTIFMTTEFLHGLYDGGHGAALNDYWNLMRNSTLGAGGFLWALIDEGVVRTDMNDWIDTDDNHAPDGILGPYREKEGSFYTISQIWSPIQVTVETIPPGFDGTIEVENHYDFLNLNTCTFEWQLVDFKEPNDPNAGHNVIASSQIPGPFAEPGTSANITISLPVDWQDRDALYLSAIDYTGLKLWAWTWNLKEPAEYRQNIVQQGSGAISAFEMDDTLTIVTGELQATFDLNNGKLINAENYGQQYSFGNGPRLVPPAASSPIVNHWHETNHYVVEANNSNGLELFRWRIYPSGWLSLYYRYQLSGQFDYFGITFDYPEEQVLGMKWLGQGAYRVWKNRMKGTTLDVWQNDYNDNIPGQTWLYPEFKGYYSDLQWLVLQTQQGPITVANDTEDLFFRMYTPQNGSNPRNTAVAFPDGDISFLHAIPPIGTKFKPPDQLGPQSQKNQAAGTYEATLYFYFGNL